MNNIEKQFLDELNTLLDNYSAVIQIELNTLLDSYSAVIQNNEYISYPEIEIIGYKDGETINIVQKYYDGEE